MNKAINGGGIYADFTDTFKSNYIVYVIIKNTTMS